MLSIVCPHYKNPKLIIDTIKNVRNTCNIDYELIVINDGCLDDSDKYIKELMGKDIKYIPLSENIGVTKVWNLGVKESKGDYICVINNDIITPKGFYKKLIDGFDKNDKELIMTMPRYTQDEDYINVLYMYHHITGFCYMINKIGKEFLFPIDERFKIFGNDNWLWMKLKYNNYSAKVVKDAICHHIKSATVKDLSKNEDREKYLKLANEEGWEVKPVYDVIEEPEGDIIYSFNPKYGL